MMREYSLTILALGESSAEAVETAIRMLNAGANFDDIKCLWDVPTFEGGNPSERAPSS